MKAAVAPVLLALMLLLGCSGPAPQQPNWEIGNAQPYADASNLFGYSLYKELAKEGQGNLVFSPYSISSAMTIAYEGAKGKTAEEMQSAMHLPSDKEVLRGSFAGMVEKLNSAGSAVELRTANAIWVHKDYEVRQDYLKVLNDAYVAKATNLDFASGTAEGTINSWVEEKTNQKIKQLIPQGALSPLTPVVITNAVYFKGKWLEEFDKKLTREREFTLLDGQKIKPMTMQRVYGKNRTAYFEDSAAQVIELPYQGEKVSMVLVLPKEEGAGGIVAVEQQLEAGKLAQWRAGLAKEKVSMWIPRFKIEQSYELQDTLPTMGMPLAFSTSADFGAMTDDPRNLYISQVIHKVYVDVNEEGTEAAAATAVIMMVGSAGPGTPEEIKEFRADRPFFFAIVEKDTGAVLFMGKVVDPRG